MGRAKKDEKINIIDTQKIEFLRKNRERILNIEQKRIQNTFLQELGKIAERNKDFIEISNISAELGIGIDALYRYGAVKRKTATPFCYTFTSNQIETLTSIFNLYISAMPFAITTNQVETIFNTYKYIGYIRVRSNRLLAYLFDKLSAKGIICNNWQEIIENSNVFASKAGKLLKAKDLSAALSRYKDDETQRYKLKKPMLEPYRTIKEMLSNF